MADKQNSDIEPIAPLITDVQKNTRVSFSAAATIAAARKVAPIVKRGRTLDENDAPSSQK